MQPSKVRLRRDILSRDKAISGALSVKNSKFGQCFLDTNIKEDRRLSLELGNLQSQLHRHQQQLEKRRKRFMAESPIVNYEPMILVDRAPTPEVLLRKSVAAEYSQFSDGTGASKKIRGYMRPLKSRATTPSVIGTMDAYCLKSRRRTNSWELPVYGEREHEIKSIVQPATKLNQREELEMELAGVINKPILNPQDSFEQEQAATALLHCLKLDKTVKVRRSKSAVPKTAASEYKVAAISAFSNITEARTPDNPFFITEQNVGHSPSLTTTIKIQDPGEVKRTRNILSSTRDHRST